MKPIGKYIIVKELVEDEVKTSSGLLLSGADNKRRSSPPRRRSYWGLCASGFLTSHIMNILSKTSAVFADPTKSQAE